MFSAAKRAAVLFARASVNLLEKLIVGFLKITRLQFLTLRHAGIASVFGLLLVSSQYINAAVPRDVYYLGYGYTEELGQRYYTPRGYCDDYSAWRAGNPNDNYTFTVVEVIDRNGTNFACGGWLRQKGTSYDMYTYIPVTAYHPCPANSGNYVANDCDCDFGYTERGGKCERNNNVPDDPSGYSCSLSNYSEPAGSTKHPILLSTGEKHLDEEDFFDLSAHPLRFSRNYLHRRSLSQSAVGAGWSHNYAERLQHEPAVAAAARVKPSPEKLTIFLGDGSERWFLPSGTGWIALGSADTLEASSPGWIHKSASDDVVRKFDALGRLRSHQQRNGWTYQYSYNAAGELQTVTNQFGRTLHFAYSGLNQLSSVSLGAAVKATYGYDGSGRLQTVTFAGGASKSYLYEDATFPQAITGIVDENGARLATFTYNANGAAVKTERAGNVSVYEVSYPGGPTGSTTVKDPLGVTRNYSYRRNGGSLAIVSSDYASGGYPNNAARRVQNSSGLIDSEKDFQGFSTSFTWAVSNLKCNT